MAKLKIINSNNETTELDSKIAKSISTILKFDNWFVLFQTNIQNISKVQTEQALLAKKSIDVNKIEQIESGDMSNLSDDELQKVVDLSNNLAENQSDKIKLSLELIEKLELQDCELSVDSAFIVFDLVIGDKANHFRS